MIASGDLSHRLKADGPYGLSPDGAVYDEKIRAIIKTADFDELLLISPEFLDSAGECGHRPLVVMIGAIGGRPVVSRLLSYQAPFGVGYAVAEFNITKSWLVQLAQSTVENYLSGKPTASSALATRTERAGVFVSIKKLGELRGCIGTTQPTTANVAAEVIQNAISAATDDPRFPAITPDELPLLSYSVDVLSPPEPIDSIELLDPRVYGVIVRLHGKQGLLLPDLDGIDDPRQQVLIAMEKAGIAEADLDQVKLARFTVKRYY